MSLVEHHCSAQPPFLWLALAAVALVLLCVLCCFCGKEKSDKVPEKMPPPAYTELTPVTSRTDAKPAPAAPAAAPTQVKPAPAAARATPVALAGAEDEAIKTWTLKGAVIPKGQSARFTQDDALPGQIGSVKSFKLTPGLPLTFHTQTGDVLTVFALKKPLQVSYDACQPLKIEKVDGHGKELGIEAGWTLTGVGYEDISEMPYQAANDLLHEKVGQLPGAIPLTFKRNNGQVATTYAYHKPLGITFPKELPIKITEEKDGHGKEIGIKIGWELLAVNYKDIRGMRDFDAVNKLLHSEVDVLPTK